ncbi:MAG: Tyrosine recombinase XerD [Chloroflexi bacterium ADurb.Bin180]|nr:MAG: Tyrosine recombinase XerD [Chloroflexi bacterium ADurb.Bin180]
MGTRTRQILRREKMEITISTLLELFLATKSTEGRSDRTIGWYKEKLGPFVRYLGNGHDALLPNLNLERARAFVASLQERDSRFAEHPYRQTLKGGLSPFTIHGYVRAMRAFSAWLVEEEFVTSDPLAKLRRPKVGEPMIEILSEQELSAIFDAISPNTVAGARIFAITLLLLDTGIRASELYGLKIESTHMNEDFIKVLGKGSKERIVPFGSTTKKALLRYINTWRPEPEMPTVSNLFLTPSGGPMTYCALRHCFAQIELRERQII